MARQQKTSSKISFSLFHHHFHKGALVGGVIALVVGMPLIALFFISQQQNSQILSEQYMPRENREASDATEKQDNRPQLVEDEIPIFVYFGNESSLNEDEGCDMVWPVRRSVKQGDDVLTASVQELIKGITEKEKTSGYYTGLSEDLAIEEVNFADNSAIAQFGAGVREYMSSKNSCEKELIQAQITSTLLQFPQVRTVEIPNVLPMILDRGANK